MIIEISDELISFHRVIEHIERFLDVARPHSSQSLEYLQFPLDS